MTQFWDLLWSKYTRYIFTNKSTGLTANKHILIHTWRNLAGDLRLLALCNHWCPCESRCCCASRSPIVMFHSMCGWKICELVGKPCWAVAATHVWCAVAAPENISGRQQQAGEDSVGAISDASVASAIDTQYDVSWDIIIYVPLSNSHDMCSASEA